MDHIIIFSKAIIINNKIYLCKDTDVDRCTSCSFMGRDCTLTSGRDSYTLCETAYPHIFLEDYCYVGEMNKRVRTFKIKGTYKPRKYMILKSIKVSLFINSYIKRLNKYINKKYEE